MTDIAIVRVERIELAFAPRPWPFAIERRAEIETHFAALQSANPSLWNGRVLMMHEHAIRGPVFHGAYLETDFATPLAWRHWDYPDARMKNCFAMGALRGGDGAFLLGVMGAHTSNPGRIYFPPACRIRATWSGRGSILPATSSARSGRRPALRRATSKWTPTGPRCSRVRVSR